MATTMMALETITVGSGGASSITFNSIPQSYTDLVVKYSARCTAIYAAVDVYINFNSVALGSQYAGVLVYGTGTASGSASSASSTWAGFISAGGSTSSTFGNNEITIPNYASSTYKSVMVDGVSENNASEAYQEIVSNSWSNTSPITSLTLTPAYNSFAQYSTFTLYGVYNSSTIIVPDTPTIGAVTDEGTATQAKISFTPGTNSGAVYTAISSPGSITGSNNSSPILVSGLENGTPYTFSVKAANPYGESSYSSSSSSITLLPPSSYESIATVTVGAGGASTISFTSIPQTYKHLQIRGVIRGNPSYTDGEYGLVRLNTDTGTNYSATYTFGNGTAAGSGSFGSSATSWAISQIGNNTPDLANSFGGNIWDILDYSNTNKYKTMRGLNGVQRASNGTMVLSTGQWRSNSAVTTITLHTGGGTLWTQYSTLALYGIKG